VFLVFKHLYCIVSTILCHDFVKTIISPGSGPAKPEPSLIEGSGPGLRSLQARALKSQAQPEA